MVGRGRGKMRVFSPQVHQKVFSLKWRENLVVEWQKCPCRLLHCSFFFLLFFFFFNSNYNKWKIFVLIFFLLLSIGRCRLPFLSFFSFFWGFRSDFFFWTWFLFLINLCDCVFLGCLSFLFCFNWASFLIRLYE